MTRIAMIAAAGLMMLAATGAHAQSTDIGRACAQVGANEWSVDEVTIRQISEHPSGNPPSVSLGYQAEIDATQRMHSVECEFADADHPAVPTKLCMDGYCFSEDENPGAFSRMVRLLRQTGF